MARKRMIDPEFWSDEEVGQWSFAARLFYIALWNFSDDEGRFKAHNALLKSQIFPYDSKISINKLKNELGNKIQWYCDEETGSQYGFVRNFLKYQKIDKPYPSKLPPPPEVEIAEHSPNIQGTVVPKIKEEKRKEEEEKRKEEAFALADEFEQEFWPNSPIKIGKGDAREAYIKARKKVAKELILAGLPKFKDYEAGRSKQLDYRALHPATWLNQERWTDVVPDIDKAAKSPPEPPKEKFVVAICAECQKRADTKVGELWYCWQHSKDKIAPAPSPVAQLVKQTANALTAGAGPPRAAMTLKTAAEQKQALGI